MEDALHTHTSDPDIGASYIGFLETQNLSDSCPVRLFSYCLTVFPYSLNLESGHLVVPYPTQPASTMELALVMKKAPVSLLSDFTAFWVMAYFPLEDQTCPLLKKRAVCRRVHCKAFKPLVWINCLSEK